MAVSLLLIFYCPELVLGSQLDARAPGGKCDFLVCSGIERIQFGEHTALSLP